MEKDACLYREKRAQKNSSNINNSATMGYRTAHIQNEIPAGINHARSARNLEKPKASCSSPGQRDNCPNAPTLGYTSLRRNTMKRQSDRVMNNQTSIRNAPRASYPFLTPPASRRELAAIWDANKTTGSPKTVICLSKDEYTSLLRPSAQGCETVECHSRPSSSIPMLSFTGPPRSESSSPGGTSVQGLTTTTSVTGRRQASTPTTQMLCQTPTSYPCCSACDPLLAVQTGAFLESYGLIDTSDHQTDSMQNCPQCQMMNVNILSSPCCPENCSLLHGSTRRLGASTEHPNSSPTNPTSPMGSRETGSPASLQCPTAYISMQEMLNSCV